MNMDVHLRDMKHRPLKDEPSMLEEVALALNEIGTGKASGNECMYSYCTDKATRLDSCRNVIECLLLLYAIQCSNNRTIAPIS